MGKIFDNFDFGGLEVEESYEEKKMKEIEEELRIPISAEETFLYSTLLANLRVQGIIALAVATSGITTSNIAGSRTANSRFKIPLDIDENKNPQIPRLIIWDEASMAKQQTIEYLERTLRDICSNDLLCGGKVIVFGGDFRQVLPVIPKSTLQEAINASFVMSPLWTILEKIHLKQNMRPLHDPAFREFLLRLGEGVPPYENRRYISMPKSFMIFYHNETLSVDQLIDAIYPDINTMNTRTLSTATKVILTPTNEDAEIINSNLVHRQPGEEYEYRSFDEAIGNPTDDYPIDFLISLLPNGFPTHHLVLKKTVLSYFCVI
ncbi:uncharacterized protein LOC104893537 [Beta vulgaris subsp. vulgaris]|uniref:uncharacterized protein LOC104893537 n=1 Tax=Beta vulgaris subsp. vulgaris TaxID=3555 RepID=UPI00053F497C|nr:uncharacterized protein LOC104893537 [Beta vulgaris subsp. vulgaris]